MAGEAAMQRFDCSFPTLVLSKAGHLLLTGDALHPWEKVREVETFSLISASTDCF